MRPEDTPSNSIPPYSCALSSQDLGISFPDGLPLGLCRPLSWTGVHSQDWVFPASAPGPSGQK